MDVFDFLFKIGILKQLVLSEVVERSGGFFEDLDLHRLEASALIDNDRSKAVLIKCGFKQIGINEKYLFINGAWRDHITFYRILEKL